MIIPYANELLDKPLILKDRDGVIREFYNYNCHLIIGETMYQVFYADQSECFFMKLDKHVSGLLKVMEWVTDPQEFEKVRNQYMKDRFMPDKCPVMLDPNDFVDYSIGAFKRD